MFGLKNPLVLYNSSFYFNICRYVSPDPLRGLCQNKRFIRGEKMPVKGNGKRPEVGQEGCQTTRWSGSCEKEKEGRGLGE